jgi:hypothetical protein
MQLQQGFATREMGLGIKLHSSNREARMSWLGIKLHSSNREARMSALGHKRTLKRFRPMSVLPPKADIAECDGDVRFVPKADS